ncbi:DnaJ-domain-containing protein [Coccomyxa subellipsoidea C-169]|uniref:DnaJ-domain-containing protein n=1 Tax=Coccomyxa subellipsoidea (strain C-169) TaxID=574566 RepID=I0YU63_COCSC|nr:DnaJ-domain-containing protein [Coccomyxa subellipsoidea C-169]EIE21932.1 DnaJ-domain-containing protein [Coccomyxa subellipsoidea C-169]|eukprot:XP_005646476.1 DnaJ-domain-containing protein [Coccomyxa subellipsoidea C-169]
MDFYRILGVKRGASQQEVKDAWRREALKNHPDRLQNASDFDRAEAARRFKEAKEAYEVLSDDGKRALYNTSGRSAVYAAQRAGRTSSYGSDFTPRARSGWSNFRYQQQRHNVHGSAFSFFRGFTRGMGRADAYFHAGFAGILVVGVVLVAPMADSLWERMNSGKLFKHMKAAESHTAVWPVRDRIQDEGERLRAQGVPPEVISGMRSINAHDFARQPADANSRSTLTMGTVTTERFLTPKRQ